MRSTDDGGVENKTACGFSVAPSVGLFSCFLLCYWQQQCVKSSPVCIYHLLDYNTDFNEAAKQKLNSGLGVILSLWALQSLCNVIGNFNFGKFWGGIRLRCTVCLLPQTRIDRTQRNSCISLKDVEMNCSVFYRMFLKFCFYLCLRDSFHS